MVRPGPAASNRPWHEPGDATDSTVVLDRAALRAALSGRRPSDPNRDATMLLPTISPASPNRDATTVLPTVPPAQADRDATMLLPSVRSATHTRSRWTALYDTRVYREKLDRIVPPESPARVVIRTTGELMVTFGLVLLLFAAYEVWGKAAIVADHQNALDAQLAQEWAQDPVAPTEPDPGATADPNAPPIPPGDAIGRLYLPRLGKYWVVVEGVEPADIEYAPGHYPESVLPGEVGNFAIAGHRSPAIFWDLDRMQIDDAVIVETQTTWFIYEVSQVLIVPPWSVEVVGPVPPGEEPGGEYLTITTCNPKWDNYERLIVHARLVGTQDRADGRPTELGGM